MTPAREEVIEERLEGVRSEPKDFYSATSYKEKKRRIDLPSVLPVIRFLPEVWRVLSDAVVVVLAATVGVAKELVRLRKKKRYNLADVSQFQ